MPLHKTIEPNPTTRILIWHITESFQELNQGILLKEKSRERMLGMQSEIHQRGFLSIRYLLKELGYADEDLSYDSNGKPYLRDGMHISITHSFQFAGIVVSDRAFGIDIEMQREKIKKIANKFLGEGKEFEENKDDVHRLTLIWGAKEAIYKIAPPVGLSFKNHIRIHFEEANIHKLNGKVNFKNEVTDYVLEGAEFEGFTCVYGTFAI
ncbi:MAG: 4-phosphopantetheinyl transferase [Flavobacteriales bacterium CG_4_9_14_3_um_filter_40_17]|nr:MAG: 4-phosphopantetheinyl transferase [Flavobacteriales bacterium CG_4_9_14_3_um_filter_40_17]